ncbi:MAG TPA: hypothetical protein VJN89_03540 [Candidatus Acidoferrum sp.]|nr:hypothetical protein [Candidatus Acidoferrum sp.]
MDDLKAAIRTALHSNNSINRESVRNWIREASDVETLALLYRLTDDAWSRITPCLEGEETCGLIRRYLVRCILENPDENIALPRQEAAGELEVWFDHLSAKKDTQKMLKDVVAAVTELFLNGDDEIRSAIETGFLEHVLEQDSLRPWFSHWAEDERLSKTWQRALAWGQAHPDYLKGLRKQLRTLRSHGE